MSYDSVKMLLVNYKKQDPTDLTHTCWYILSYRNVHACEHTSTFTRSGNWFMVFTYDRVLSATCLVNRLIDYNFFLSARIKTFISWPTFTQVRSLGGWTGPGWQVVDSTAVLSVGETDNTCLFVSGKKEQKVLRHFPAWLPCDSDEQWIGSTFWIFQRRQSG